MGQAVVLVVLGLAACRETGGSDPRAPATSTVTARRPAASSTVTKEGAQERSDESAGVRARAIALAGFAAGDAPVYPEASRRLQEEGSVDLRIELLQDGSIQSVEVARSSGHRRLDDAALAAARTWRFNPRTGGEAVEVIRHRVVFWLVDE